MKMHAPYVKTLSLDEMLDPAGAKWSRIQSEQVSLVGTSIELQPTAYIRSKWHHRTIGNVKTVQVKAVHNGQSLAFHLQWKVSAGDMWEDKGDRFPDAAAVALDPGNTTSFHTMGSSGSPLNIWHWRADTPESGRQVTATGIGTTEVYERGTVRAAGQQTQDGWQVVIARSLHIPHDDEFAQLKVGDKIDFSVAVWHGISEERGGLKAFSPQPLSINLLDKGERS